MDLCVFLEVGSVGTATFVPQQDYVLDSVFFGGQAANSLAFLSQNPATTGIIAPATVSLAEFLLMFFGFQMVQVNGLGYPARKGIPFYFDVAQGGGQLNLFFTSAGLDHVV